MNQESKIIKLFTKEQLKRWGPVDTYSVVRIANACNTGCNFVGTNKKSIYEDFERQPRGYKTDPEAFVLMMDQAAKVSANHKEALFVEIGEIIINARKNRDS